MKVLGYIMLSFIMLFLVISAFPYILIGALIYSLYRLIRYIRKVRYFKSPNFLAHKLALADTISEYNEISNYVNSFDQISLRASQADRYKYSNLATYQNTSVHNMNRNRHQKTLSSNVHHASLAVVRKASEELLKYLCKYFDFKPNEENLQRIQDIGEVVSRFTNAKSNLDMRLAQIEADFNPPKFIKKYYRDELLKHLEVNIPKIHFYFPQYIFEYVSAGGNSSQRTTIKLDDLTIEALIEYIDDNIKRSKTAKAQRSLMTKKLREFIKRRDNYTCQNCYASVAQQNLLLLEVDHIIPISKGGLSTKDNLQTLCWKCNRTKSNKII